MNILIKETELFINNKKVLESNKRIKEALQFGSNKIIVRKEASPDNLFCINTQGDILWIAQSISPKVYVPYQAFDIRNGKIYGGALTPSYGVSAELDPETGKILNETIGK